jgi:hypothetical protein
MEKEFVPYELALRMKQLGFDEPCFAYYYTLNGRDWKFAEKTEYYKLDDNMNIGGKYTISAPLFQQAFRWFREKYTTKGWVTPIVNVDGFSDIHEARIHQEESSVLVLGNYDSYEEAELACLEKLIKIVEQTNAEMTDHGVYK